jgi:glucose/arabinose dehydrogenase
MLLQPFRVRCARRLRAGALALGAGVLFGVGGCGGGGAGSHSSPTPNEPDFVPTTQAVTVTAVVSGLSYPWGLAFLPDQRMLVTGRMGQLWLIGANGSSVQTVSGLPAVTATGGQGGLLDVVLDPAFATNRRVYFSYAEADLTQPARNGTAVARAELDLDQRQLLGLTVLYRQAPKVQSNGHFGSRLVFGADGHLFVTLGDRQNADQMVFAQDLGQGHGKVVRITTEGGAAPGNPFAATPGAQPEIWSYGHRNPQGAALHPTTGELWTNEHGPQGGDEVNRTLAGRNHGWPVISHGQYYGTTQPVGEGTAKPGMEPPVSVWEMADGSTWVSGAKSSTAPSGMAFFTGSTPAHWPGSLFVGALAGRALWRLQLHGHQVVGRERLLTALGERIRDVRMGPDGYLWLLTDGSDGRLLRVSVP